MLSDLMTRKKMLQQLQQLDLPAKKNHIFFIYKSNFSSLHVILLDFFITVIRGLMIT